MKRITRICCLIILLLPLMSFAQDETRQVLVYFHDIDHHWHWHHAEHGGNVNLTFTTFDEEQTTKHSILVDHDEEWYRFDIPINKEEIGAELSYFDKAKHLEIPPGNRPIYIAVSDGKLFPYEVELFTEDKIEPLLRADKTHIEGEIEIPDALGPNFPKRVELFLPFANWGGWSYSF